MTNNTEAVLAAVKDYDLSKLPELVEAIEAVNTVPNKGPAMDYCDNCIGMHTIEPDEMKRIMNTLNAVTRKG